MSILENPIPNEVLDNATSPLTDDRAAYKDSTYEIVSKVAYLIGVPKRIFDNEHEAPKVEVYNRLDSDKTARIIRHLCIVRTAIERNFKRINERMKDELGRTDNPQLLRKVEILQAFLDRVVVGLESADEIDAAYNDFENEAKREEIVAFAKTEDIDASMLTDIISEYEFSGTMDAGNIRDRIEKPLPLLKKRSLVNRIVDFIRQHTEKYQ